MRQRKQFYAAYRWVRHFQRDRSVTAPAVPAVMFELAMRARYDGFRASPPGRCLVYAAGMNDAFERGMTITGRMSFIDAIRGVRLRQAPLRLGTLPA